MQKTLEVVLSATLFLFIAIFLLFIPVPHAHAAIISSQEDSSGAPSHYWHSDGSSGGYLVIDPKDGQPGYSIGIVTASTANVIGIHIKVQVNSDGYPDILPRIPVLYDESGTNPYACAQLPSGGYAYGSASDAMALTNPLTYSQFNGKMVDMYFQCYLGSGHDQVYANTSYRLYLYPVSTLDVSDIYVAMNAAGTLPFYEISDDGTYPPPPAPISITTPQQGTTYFSTDTIMPQATIANFSSYTSVTYLLNGTIINPTQPLPIASLPSGTATLVIAATDSLGNTTYATSTFIVVHAQSPLTVTANNLTMTLGGTLPPLTANLSGFVNGNTATSSDVTGSARCTTTATSASPVGTYPIICTAGTLASLNYTFSTFVPGTLTITYRWDGFLQPINDTAHQISESVSVFKGGSTVPVKLQLKKADGTVVQVATAPLWSAPALIGPMSTSVDELTYSDPASGGNTYVWDGTQYQYNWSTKGVASGNWYRIYARLDDGTVQSVVIGLR